jgi:hypothetical protein
VSPEAVARWERERSRGRSHFIWRRGVVGWGVPAAMLTIAYKAWQLHALGGAFAMTNDLRDGIALSVVVFPLCGYMFGSWLWTREEGEYEAHRRGRDRN